MTSEQMFYGIAIPSVVYLIATFLSHRSLAVRLEGLAAGTYAKIGGLDGKVDAVIVRLDGTIDGLETRLDSIDGKLTVIEGDLRTFHNVTGKLEGRLDELSKH